MGGWNWGESRDDLDALRNLIRVVSPQFPRRQSGPRDPRALPAVSIDIGKVLAATRNSSIMALNPPIAILLQIPIDGLLDEHGGDVATQL